MPYYYRERYEGYEYEVGFESHAELTAFIDHARIPLDWRRREADVGGKHEATHVPAVFGPEPDTVKPSTQPWPPQAIKDDIRNEIADNLVRQQWLQGDGYDRVMKEIRTVVVACDISPSGQRVTGGKEVRSERNPHLTKWLDEDAKRESKLIEQLLRPFVLGATKTALLVRVLPADPPLEEEVEVSVVTPGQPADGYSTVYEFTLEELVGAPPGSPAQPTPAKE